MLDTVLHVGVEPSALWLVAPGLLSFLAGLGFGVYSDRVREWLRPRNAEVADSR